MKANEAPKKVYFTATENGHYYTEGKPFERECTEYVRKDTFIEKVCEFINKANLYLYHCVSEECDLVNTDKFIEDFKKYMDN